MAILFTGAASLLTGAVGSVLHHPILSSASGILSLAGAWVLKTLREIEEIEEKKRSKERSTVETLYYVCSSDKLTYEEAKEELRRDLRRGQGTDFRSNCISSPYNPRTWDYTGIKQLQVRVRVGRRRQAPSCEREKQDLYRLMRKGGYDSVEIPPNGTRIYDERQVLQVMKAADDTWGFETQPSYYGNYDAYSETGWSFESLG